MFNDDPSRCLLGWLVRHGELEKMSIWDGWGEYTLSEEGLLSAEKAAQYLSYEKIGRIISSDVPRAMETARIIADGCDVACPFQHTDPNLRPWMVAGFTGKEKTPERVAEFKKYIEDRDLVIPEGESLHQLDDRVQVIASYLASPYQGLPTVISIHNSVIKAFMGIDAVADAVSPGGIISVYMNEKGELDFEVVLGAVEPQIGVS